MTCRTGKRGRRWRGGVHAVCALILLSLPPAGAPWAGDSGNLRHDEPVWTDRPIRIDRNNQPYERIAVERLPERFPLRISSRATVFDSASFRDGGRIYVLTGVVAVDPGRRCRQADGGLAICGQQARVLLRRLVQNVALACEEDFRLATVSFVTCRRQGRDLATVIIENGAGWAALPALAAAQEEAMRMRKGIWADARCRETRRCPPGEKR
ncbi:hypothetical protein KYK29_13695 [Shinella daejeonensis]|uniref:hypothetical protein n=1 Tax=Shinella daejeonensis TaxID=659017 RepID=UPI0020C7C983|nr:hypothetical protein [Shinella daejeonensis]MCP8895981.1 hypothetical protein [Shinella daejeonensis]